MSKTTAPKSTPSPTGGEKQTPEASRAGRDVNPRTEFLSAILDMTWQLAVVVLIPLIGGFKLDEKFNTSPLWTITGFIVAMAGTALVLWRMSQQVSRVAITTPKKEAK